MGKKEIRVMHTCPLSADGITSMILNICENIDREKINFDYLTYLSGELLAYDRAIKLGGRVVVIDNSDATNKVMKFLLKFVRFYKAMKVNTPDILHINASTPYDTLVGISAKLAGVKKVVAHSHNANSSNNSLINKLVQAVCRVIMPLYVDAYFTCSTEAAEYLFPRHIVKQKKYQYIKNGINIEKFRFDLTRRATLRLENGLDEYVVIGHIGRFFKQKNHVRIISIFNEFCKKHQNAKLLLVGQGELREQIEREVTKLKLQDKVIFWGTSDRVYDLMKMMDVLLMPSLHEGLPVVGIEAQATGLPCVFSDVITREVDLTGNCQFVKLEDSDVRWAEILLEQIKVKYDRSVIADHFMEAGYDIVSTSHCIEECYNNLMNT